MSGPPHWLAYACIASLWVAAGCAGMAILSACTDQVGRNRPEKAREGPQEPRNPLPGPRGATSRRTALRAALRENSPKENSART